MMYFSLQTSSNTFRNQSQSIGSSSPRLSSGTDGSSMTVSSNQTYYSPIDCGISSSSSRNVPSPPVIPYGSPSLSSSTLSSGRSTNGSFKPFSPIQTFFNPIDPSISKNAPSPPAVSNSPRSSPKNSRSPRVHRRSGPDSFPFIQQAPNSPRSDSPSYYDMNPQGFVGFKDRTNSPSRKSGSLDQSSRSASHQTSLLSPSDSSLMGLRSPRHDKGPSPLSFKRSSPLPFNQAYSSTLPRNFHGSGPIGERVFSS